MKVLIIEDESPAARRLKQLLQEQDKNIQILAILESIAASVQWFNAHPSPDLIFMDIQLADGLSFDIFTRVAISAPVIFTTAYDEYAFRAFKVNSIDYLLKPIDAHELGESLGKLKKLTDAFLDRMDTTMLQTIVQSLQSGQKSYRGRFLVKLGDRLVFIYTKDIAYFIAEDKLVFLITADHKRYATDYSLDELEPLLQPKEFFRINRQLLVHIQSIRNIIPGFSAPAASGRMGNVS